MKAPAFWDRPDALSGKMLSPLGWLYAGTTAWRLAHGKGWRAPVRVICVGNLTAGGAGKTPVVRDLALRLSALGMRPAILSRGYGGSGRGPLKIDPVRHDAAKVGDEPLLLAGDAPCWIARDRAEGARAMAADGAGIIVMDDGLQNPDLAQDLRLIVVDGATGFGNGRAIPAGPLRECIDAGIARADAMIVVGDDMHDLAAIQAGSPSCVCRDISPTPLCPKGDHSSPSLGSADRASSAIRWPPLARRSRNFRPSPTTTAIRWLNSTIYGRAPRRWMPHWSRRKRTGSASTAYGGRESERCRCR